jgi:hypothetical protein
MPDFLVVNTSNATVQTVPAGQIRKVTLTDSQASSAAQTAGVAVLRSDSRGKVRQTLAAAIKDWRVTGAADRALNRVE